MANILVVDAERDLREVVTLSLASAGHTVVETASGLEAIELAAGREIDLVFLDVDLEELGGPAVARVIRDLGAVPIIATSGRVDEWQTEVLAIGATACLPKPFDVLELGSVVRAVLRPQVAREGRWPTDVRRLSPDELAALEQLSRSELDALPFGAIALDGDGRILEFNAYESETSAHAAEDVRGMRFSELAPCASVQKLARRLESAVRGEAIDSVIRFVFPHGRGRALVSVRVHRDPLQGRAWIFVSARPGPLADSIDRDVTEASKRLPR
ncbi:MAG: response regulator [Myxococcota bacterium]|nr:response regulator [Myxococcota bacterium]